MKGHGQVVLVPPAKSRGSGEVEGPGAGSGGGSDRLAREVAAARERRILMGLLRGALILTLFNYCNPFALSGNTGREGRVLL